MKLRNITRPAGKAVTQVADPRSLATWRRFRSFTMIEPTRYMQNLWLARQAPAGSVVECGVWRGGMIGGIAATLGPERHYVLFDSFEGLPPAGELDGPGAAAYQADTTNPRYFDNCAAERSYAEQAMRLARATNVEIHQGWFEDTIPGWAKAAEPIGLLRLDGDWYESTLTCLTHLFPLVATGGYVLIDDYGSWQGCTKAVHEYLAAHQRPEAVRRTISGVAYLVKA